MVRGFLTYINRQYCFQSACRVLTSTGMNADIIIKITSHIQKFMKNLLYKDEKPSVCLSVLAALITFPSRDVWTPDLLEMKATSSGINKFFSKSF